MSASQTPGAPTEQEWAEAICSASWPDNARDGFPTRLAPLIDREREAARAEGMAAVAGPVLALMEAEIASDTESNVRSEVAGVRCLDCNLRYEEREEYGCHETGRGHSYDDEDIADAEASARADAIEYVTVSVADLRAAIPADATEALARLKAEWQARALIAEAKVARVEALADEWEQKTDAIAITYQDPDRRRMATLGQRVNIRQLRAALAAATEALSAPESDEQSSEAPRVHRGGERP